MEQHIGESQPVPHRKGQALAEFALTAPLLLLLIFGIIEFGILFYNKAVITNASRRRGASRDRISDKPRHGKPVLFKRRGSGTSGAKLLRTTADQF